MKFQFLEYLSANPGISFHELEIILYYAYRTMEDSAMTSTSIVTYATVEGIDFEENEIDNVNAQGMVTKEGTGVKGRVTPKR